MNMVLAKCRKCGGHATADTYDTARKLINHAVGLSRGIKCGDSYNCVEEIGKIQNIIPPTVPPTTQTTPTTQTPKPEVTKPEVTKPEVTKPESSLSPKKYKKTKSSV